MEIRPILSALSRTKIAVFLIILQIAITLAVITNAISIVNKNESDMNRPTGVDLDNTFVVNISTVNTEADPKAIIQSELAKITATPGVMAVTPGPVVPLSGNILFLREMMAPKCICVCTGVMKISPVSMILKSLKAEIFYLKKLPI